jgi:hypothetical protein
MPSPAILGFQDLEPVPFHLWGMFMFACHLRRGEPISALQTGKHFGMNWRTARKQLDELVDLGLAERVRESQRRFSYYPSDKWETLRHSAIETKAITWHRTQTYANHVG